MPDPITIISLGALAVSLATFVLMQRGHRHTVKTSYVEGLERRVSALERDLETSQKKLENMELKNGTLLAENIELLRRLAALA